MGGSGSGRSTSRATTAALPKLDIRKLYREEQLRPTAKGCTVQAKTGPEHEVSIVWTPCHYGGARPWFLCPRCGTRRAVLYVHPQRAACRVCWNLAYPSQREGLTARMGRRIDKLLARGWTPEDDPGGGRKKKGLHWRTLDRLSAEIDAAERIQWREMERFVERLRLMSAR